MQTTYEPMPPRKRAELEELVSPATLAMRAGLFGLVIGALGWFLARVQLAAFVGTGAAEGMGGLLRVPIWLLTTIGVGYVLYHRSGRWTGGRELRDRIRRDLQRGEVARHRVTVVAAIEAPEIEDEGPVFFVNDAEGDVIFLAGQEMSRYQAKGFPWAEFEIVETPESRRFVGLERHAGPFEGTLVREPLSMDQARRFGVFEAEFGVMSVPWEELLPSG